MLLDGNPSASDRDQLVEGIFARSMARTVPLNPAFLRSTSLSFVFLWAGWLSFVYESKEIMRHEEGVG
ncbi:hypothetical protein IE4872_PD00390 (plasmid) [Rhizobium gallicum]|uniref:Uncharacterized protein n=1 Tax=Rhizobium gallicum TaxID=56730 RepID=A0A1L5NSQ2_9HYPH|nr:hypothetical protein IE4872_PD00390 [Rhizobium gallicum]